MSLRIFISCDICNHAGVIRTEERRVKRRLTGRRHYDEREYVIINDLGTKRNEVDAVVSQLEAQAREQDWTITEGEMHFCQNCFQKHHQDIENFKGNVHELNSFILSQAQDPDED